MRQGKQIRVKLLLSEDLVRPSISPRLAPNALRPSWTPPMAYLERQVFPTPKAVRSPFG